MAFNYMQVQRSSSDCFGKMHTCEIVGYDRIKSKEHTKNCVEWLYEYAMHNSLKCISGSLREKQPTMHRSPWKWIFWKRSAMKWKYARLKSYKFNIIVDDASAMKTAVVLYTVQ